MGGRSGLVRGALGVGLMVIAACSSSPRNSGGDDVPVTDGAADTGGVVDLDGSAKADIAVVDELPAKDAGPGDDAGAVGQDVPEVDLGQDVPAVDLGPTPPADPCATITDLGGRPLVDGALHVTGSTASAPLAGGLTAPTDCVAAGRFGRQVMYRYTMRTTAALEVRTDNPGTDATLDTIVAIASACGPSETVLDCDDDISRSDFRSILRSDGTVPAGTTLVIAVGAYTPPYDASYTDRGAFELTIRELVPDCGSCRDDADCANGACIHYGADTTRTWCSRRCTTNSDCVDPRMNVCSGGLCGLSSRTSTCSADRSGVVETDSCGGSRSVACPAPQQCDATGGAGCRMPGSCTGTPAACSGRSTETSCRALRGCSYNHPCEGSAQSCSSFVGSASCRAQDGCDYEGLYPRGSCRGSATSCRYFSYTNQSGCTRQRGCRWEARCEGTPTACSEFHTQTDCSAQGCTWR